MGMLIIPKPLSPVSWLYYANSISMWYSTSTCAMMSRDVGGEVDHRLLVHGTDNLRIVDTSIMPVIPRANIQSTVYAVAERVADLIRAELVADP